MKLDKLSLQFALHETGRADDVLEAYERLIYDAMIGDHTLFTTAEGIERLWELSTPLLDNPPPVRLYPPGSWGPNAIHQLIAPNAWRLPFERAWREPDRRRRLGRQRAAPGHGQPRESSSASAAARSSSPAGGRVEALGLGHAERPPAAVLVVPRAAVCCRTATSSPAVAHAHRQQHERHRRRRHGEHRPSEAALGPANRSSVATTSWAA